METVAVLPFVKPRRSQLAQVKLRLDTPPTVVFTVLSDEIL